MVSVSEIAVVGAGVAGLASAIMLSRLGCKVTLYERFATPRPIGSGLMLQPTGLAALERLGLRRELERCGSRIERIHGATASGLMTPFFQSDSALLSATRDLTFNRMKAVPYLHREMIRTLAGLKTGLFTCHAPEEIVNGLADRRRPAVAVR